MKKRAVKIITLVMSLALIFGSVGSVYAAADSSDSESSGDITILYTNDVHSYIDEDITYSTIASYKDSLDNVLLVDAGDHIQGTAYGSMDEGETIIELMNAAGYDLATLGNHEFDYGMDGALSTIESADFDYVSCNFYSINDDGSDETVLDSYEVFEVNGVSIAFIGITTPESITKSTPAYFQDEDGNYIYEIAGGSDGSELYEAVQTAIDAASEEADIVIALGHLGVDESSSPWTSEEVIANTTGLDAFIDGHSHTTMESETVTDKEGNSVVLTQTGCYLDNLGQMTITINDDGTYSITTELLDSEDLAEVTPDSEVAAIEENWIAEVDELLGEKIAESDIEFTIYDEDGNRLIREAETNMGDLNADAYYWYINEVANLDCDVAIMNGGGIRASAEAGDWTYLTCKTINTFGNVLCVVEVTGQDILDALEFGARYTTADASGAECGGFLQVAGLTYKVDTSIENTITEDENSIWVSGPSEYRVYDVQVYNKETGEYEDLDLDATYTLGGTNYTLRDCGDGFDMFSDSYLVLDGICEDYLALAAYVAAFTDTDGNGYANISTETSPLASYEGYLLDYENASGSGRISIADGKTSEDTEDETVEPETEAESEDTAEPETEAESEEPSEPETEESTSSWDEYLSYLSAYAEENIDSLTPPDGDVTLESLLAEIAALEEDSYESSTTYEVLTSVLGDALTYTEWLAENGSSSEDTTEPETEAESEEPSEPETEAESEEPSEPETEAESEEPSEPETEAESEDTTEPETEAESEEPSEPETEAESEDTSEPETEAESEDTAEPETEETTSSWNKYLSYLSAYAEENIDSLTPPDGDVTLESLLAEIAALEEDSYESSTAYEVLTSVLGDALTYSEWLEENGASSEDTTEPETEAEPEDTAEPETEAEPEDTAEPETEAEPEDEDSEEDETQPGSEDASASEDTGNTSSETSSSEVAVGDTSNLALWISLAAAALIGLACLGLKRKFN